MPWVLASVIVTEPMALRLPETEIGTLTVNWLPNAAEAALAYHEAMVVESGAVIALPFRLPPDAALKTKDAWVSSFVVE